MEDNYKNSVSAVLNYKEIENIEHTENHTAAKAEKEQKCNRYNYQKESPRKNKIRVNIALEDKEKCKYNNQNSKRNKECYEISKYV